MLLAPILVQLSLSGSFGVCMIVCKVRVDHQPGIGNCRRMTGIGEGGVPLWPQNDLSLRRGGEMGGHDLERG